MYYGVRVGREPGVYRTWEDCEKQVKSYSGAVFKKFKTQEEALSFIGKEKEVGESFPAEAKEDQLVGSKKDSRDESALLKLDSTQALAYVDGSFNLADFTYSYGLVLISKAGKETYSGRDSNPELASMRNVAGELKGAMVAMELAREKGFKTLYLHYDYTGIEQWALGNWKTNKEGTRYYKDFYDRLSKDLHIVFVKVKAHSGVKYNEEADQLAKDAL